MANVEGGVVAFGIRTERKGKREPDRAAELASIADAEQFAASIDEYKAQLTDPAIAGLQIRAITRPASKEGVVLVYVPQSDGGPHRGNRSRPSTTRGGMIA